MHIIYFLIGLDTEIKILMLAVSVAEVNVVKYMNYIFASLYQIP